MNRTIQILFIICLACQAAQFVLHDDVCTWPAKESGHTHGGGAAFWKWFPDSDVELNWEPPVNYKEGVSYVRFECLDKQEPGYWTTAFTMWSANRVLGTAHFHFPKSGAALQEGVVHTYEGSIAGLHWDGGGTDHVPDEWDWTHVTTEGYIFCGCGDDPPRYRHPWDSKADPSLPTYDAMDTITLRVTVIVVSKGSVFRMPKGWTEFGKLDIDSLLPFEAPYFTAIDSVVVEPGRTFAHSIHYENNTGAAVEVEFVKMPQGMITLGNMLQWTAPQQEGVDTVKVTLKIGETVFDSLTLRIITQAETGIGPSSKPCRLQTVTGMPFYDVLGRPVSGHVLVRTIIVQAPRIKKFVLKR